MKRLPPAEEVIDLLDLEPSPVEGGFFRQTYVILGHPELGRADPQASAIFCVVTPEAYSAPHRLRYDEMFHCYLGDPCVMVICDQDGMLELVAVGHRGCDRQMVQHLVPARSWQGLRLSGGGRFARLGTTMSPGFGSYAFQFAETRDVDRFASDIAESLIPFLAPQSP